MKQHITEEQLLELKDFQFVSLYNFVTGYKRKTVKSSNGYSGFYGGKYKGFGYCNHENFVKGVTIGKMIEILSFYESSYCINHCEGEYCITLDRGMGGIEIPTNCLCDALWEAVKEVI